MPPIQPKPNNAAMKYAKAFVDCLTEESAYYTTSLPKDALNPSQLAVLRRIDQHFNQSDRSAIDDPPLSSRSGQVSKIDGNEDDQLDPSTPKVVITSSKRGVGCPGKSEGTPTTTSPVTLSAAWGAIMSMKEIKLDDGLRNSLMTTTIDNAASFLDVPDSSPANPIDQPIPDVKVFTTFCVDISRMSKNTAKDRLNWLFLVLTMGAMADALFGESWSSRKSDALEDAVIKECDTEIYASIVLVKKIATQLSFICRTLGTGCLFFLESVLTETFLKDRVTRSGRAYGKAMQHLEGLGFPNSVEESGQAQAMGDAIISHLRSVYKLDQIGADAADISESDGDAKNSGDDRGTMGSDDGGKGGDQDSMQD